MGREIVYCEACGLSLRESDFEKGKACEVDNRPYCTACAPFKPAAAPRPDSPRAGTRKAMPSVTPRAAMSAVPRGRTHPMLVPGIVGGAILLLLLIALAGTGDSARSPSPVETPPRPVVEIPATPKPRDPPPAPRTEEGVIPRRPTTPAGEDTLRGASDAEKAAQFESFLAQIRERIGYDKEFRQRREIDGMIAAAEKTAGPRASDVKVLKDSYANSFEIAGNAAVDAARAEAESLWAEKKYAAAVERARQVPPAFQETRRAEELSRYADDLERKQAEAAEKDRLEALGAWKLWKVESSKEGGMPKLLDSYAGRSKVFETHPLTREKPASLERSVEIPARKKSTLTFWVAPHQKGDWQLRVLADGKLLHKQDVTPANCGWKPVTVDLSPLAGKTVLLRLENAATGWAWEFGYWSDIEVTSE